MSYGLSVGKTDFTEDLFWTDYTLFDNNNDSFDGDEFICKIKDIRDCNSNLCNQKYSLTCTNILGFVACNVTSKFCGIVAAERSWGDVKKITSCKISSIRIDVSEKQIIVYN